MTLFTLLNSIILIAILAKTIEIAKHVRELHGYFVEMNDDFVNDAVDEGIKKKANDAKGDYELLKKQEYRVMFGMSDN